MSILSVTAQVYFKASLGLIVPAKLFMPPPKVDSQVLILDRRSKPLFGNQDPKELFRLVKAGFSERRKKLRSSLSGGLQISKQEAEKLLESASIDPNLRAQNLSLADWIVLSSGIYF
jgi:16S rRNA (adenine1518-N6/adenine1519-N6)-dimethyltransferase